MENVPENGVFSCVPFCLRSHGRFARCVLLRPHNHSLFALLILSPDFSGGDLSEFLALKKLTLKLLIEAVILSLACYGTSWLAPKLVGNCQRRVFNDFMHVVIALSS